MSPCWELLHLPGATDRELRATARAHACSGDASHVSRSYAAPLAVVAWHRAPVGVDIERVGPCDRDFAESICTPEELALFARALDDDAFVTSLWASKEALAKALGDARAYDPRRLGSPLSWEDGAAGRWRASHFIPAAGHVAWLVWSAVQNSAANAFSADSIRLAAGRR